MKRVVIIGASSGIGRQLATQLAQGSSEVIGTYYQHSVESCQNIIYHYLNVNDADLDLSFVPEALDGLVYCPGSINLVPFARISPEQFIEDFNLQVVGAIKVIRKLIPNLKKAVDPSVVLFSTIAVQTGLSFHSQVAVSKGAIEGLTRSLAAELAPKIRVNAIAPSLTDTPLSQRFLNTEKKIEANAARHPMKRIGSAADIANAATYLLSDKASWVTGQIFHIDGGLSKIKL